MQNKRDVIIDNAIKALKTIGHNDALFGTFLIAEGLSLIFAMWLFPVFVTLSILIAYAFALEWFFGVIRGERTTWNIVQRILIIIIIIALLIYCGFIIFDERFRVGVDRVIVSITTILDGGSNLIQSLKLEEGKKSRTILAVASGLCVLYGIIYGIVGGAEANFFTTTIHGIVFIFLGATDIWLYFIARRTVKDLSELKKQEEAQPLKAENSN
ncbi:hypothetical protein IJ114_02165 [Candidatus Saccharibacteria bacterium]|nr:hypothetical protein [Candidatus Saccharibacteria bacterium]